MTQIKLNEAQLRDIVSSAVRKVLNEDFQSDIRASIKQKNDAKKNEIYSQLEKIIKEHNIQTTAEELMSWVVDCLQDEAENKGEEDRTTEIYFDSEEYPDLKKMLPEDFGIWAEAKAEYYVTSYDAGSYWTPPYAEGEGRVWDAVMRVYDENGNLIYEVNIDCFFEY